VEPVRHLVGPKDVDVRRQLVVDAPPQRLRWQRRHHVEMGHLGRCMDAGVGPAGTVQLEILPPRHGSHRAVELALHGARVLLNLPAAEPRAGVLDGQLEAGHREEIYNLQFTIHKNSRLRTIPSAL
jgi:hypothetical protein